MTGHLPIFERAVHEFERHIHHPHPTASYDQPDTPEEHPMLDLATIEHDAAAAAQNVIGHLQEAAKGAEAWARTHVGPVADELARLQASPLVQAAESLALTPAEEAAAAKVLSEFASLFRGGHAPAAAAPDEAPEPEDEPGPAPEPLPAAGPVVGGQAH